MDPIRRAKRDTKPAPLHRHTSPSVPRSGHQQAKLKHFAFKTSLHNTRSDCHSAPQPAAAPPQGHAPYSVAAGFGACTQRRSGEQFTQGHLLTEHDQQLLLPKANTRQQRLPRPPVTTQTLHSMTNTCSAPQPAYPALGRHHLCFAEASAGSCLPFRTSSSRWVAGTKLLPRSEQKQGA